MENSSTNTASCIIVDVAPDRMAAYIRLRDECDIAGLTDEKILNVLKEAGRLDQDMASRAEAVAKIRQTAQPLLANQKRLTPSQRERATELLCEVDTMESQIEDDEKRRDEMLENARAVNVPSVLVSEIAHPSISIQIGRRQTVLQADLKGPVRIEKRNVDNVTEFVAINQLTGSSTVLPSVHIEEANKQDPVSEEEEGPSAHASGR